MKKVLITGAAGQLGKCFRKHGDNFPGLELCFYSSAGLDITNRNAIVQAFAAESPAYVINCAAYTNVEKAEDEVEMAFRVNAEAAGELADACRKNRAVLIHFSTDYVFDGKAKRPYKEKDPVRPINNYGASKLTGEEMIQKQLSSHFIFRTSWLYSEFGHNFLNTILIKAAEGADLKITGAQTGSPTNANDLAEFVLKLITRGETRYGLYHYSNYGQTSWYDFARAIVEFSGLQPGSLEETGHYPTKAERPVYSVLDKTHLQESFDLPVPLWNESLKGLIEEIRKK